MCLSFLPFCKHEERKQTDHVQIMGLSVCTIYCPPSTRFLYKIFLFFFFLLSCRGNVSTRCRFLHLEMKEFFTHLAIAFERTSIDEILSISCRTCIMFFVIAPDEQLIAFHHISQSPAFKFYTNFSYIYDNKSYPDRNWL